MEENKFKYPFQNPELTLEDRVDDLVSRLTLNEKINLTSTAQGAVERLGIKAYSIGGEAAHGVARVGGKATVFPQPIGLACTFDKKLLYSIGSVIGDEARAYYKKNGEKHGLTLWAPTVDMERDPRWGRTEEAYGEDPCLTGELSTALVRGMQGSHPFYIKMSAALKHFFANNNEIDRCSCSVSVDPRNMREYYLNAFKSAIVNGGVSSMMTAYNSVNGKPCIIDPIVNEVVKKEWGMNGFVVCDGLDFSQTVTHHKYTSSYAEVAAEALKNGVDCLTDNPELVHNSVLEALDKGMICEKDIDNTIKNIFRIRFRLGQFDPEELNPYSKINEDKICNPKHCQLAYKAACEAIVLLKNEKSLLPLDSKKLKKIAVIGPLADVVFTDYYSGILPYKITPLKGIKAKMQGKKVLFREGCDVVAFSSKKSGKYITVDSKDRDSLKAKADQITDSEKFDLTDWGWNNVTLKSHANGNFVTTGNDDSTQVEGVTGEQSENELKAISHTVKGWFVRELFDITCNGEGICNINTWDKKKVAVQPNEEKPIEGLLKVQGGADVFKKHIIEDGILQAVEAAKESEVAVVFVGNNPFINGKEDKDRPDIVLPKAQEELIKAVYAANPNTIVVIIGSYPFAINWVDQNIPAILYSAHGGQEAGKAIADVIFGEHSPAGRLNMTWYKSVEQLPDIMDYDIIKGKRTYMYFDGEPLYPFGYGLTYTKFKYSGMSLSSKFIDKDDAIIVKALIENSGEVSSSEVVQLYVRSLKSRVKRPIKELKDFERVYIEAGEKAVINFTITHDDFCMWDVTRDKYCVEEGQYEIMLGSSSEDIRLIEIIEVKGEIIPKRDLKRITRAENYDDYNMVFLDECKEARTCVSPKANEGWISFYDVDFGEDTVAFEGRASNEGESTEIEIRLDAIDGELLGKCKIPKTGGTQVYETINCKIKEIKGTHKVFLKFMGKVNLSWLRFI